MSDSSKEMPGPMPRVCVVKIGGSIVSTADWAARLEQWLRAEMETHINTHFVLIVGGGTLVDALREIDKRTPLGDEVAHWSAIRLMNETASIVGSKLPKLVACDHYEQLQRRIATAGVTIFPPYQFLREVEPCLPGIRLPATWDVTSDSIAGRLAIVLAADELILLKSRPIPREPKSEDPDIVALHASGMIDSFFLRLGDALPRLRVSSLQ